jgi:hypothetical protein
MNVRSMGCSMQSGPARPSIVVTARARFGWTASVRQDATTYGVLDSRRARTTSLSWSARLFSMDTVPMEMILIAALRSGLL